MEWKIKGDYFENCNCDILCPCITSSLQAPADYDRCLVPLVCHIEQGSFGEVALDGLNFIIVADTPPIMGDGHWRVALYIDERANDQQRDALNEILSGAHGGVPGMLAASMDEILGVKFVPIHYHIDGKRRRVEVPNIMEFEVEGITAPGHDAVMEITNVSHPMGTALAVAKGEVGHYDDPDYQFAFDNTGKNGHYSAFAWQGA